MGHGVGIEIDEVPFLARGSRTALGAGTAIAVEPKLACRGRGMVRIEDVLVGGRRAAPIKLPGRDRFAL